MNNVVVKKSVHPAREEGNLLSHVDLVQMLDIVDLEQGTTVAGKCCCSESVSDCVMFLLHGMALGAYTFIIDQLEV